MFTPGEQAVCESLWTLCDCLCDFLLDRGGERSGVSGSTRGDAPRGGECPFGDLAVLVALRNSGGESLDVDFIAEHSSQGCASERSKKKYT